MRILAIERDKLATNYYRILNPLHELDRQGLAEVYFLPEAQLGSERALQLALYCDILVFHRPASEAWFKFINVCRKNGKLIVSDYDDDPFNTSPLNPYYQYVGTEEVKWRWPDGTEEWLWSEDMVSSTGQKIFNIERNINARDMFRLNFKRSDLVSCTTEELKTEFLKINPNVAVLPNCIDPDFFPKGHELVKKEVRIGWQGGASHYEDLYLVKDAIIETLNRFENTKFVFFGDMRFQGLFKDINPKQIEFHSWTNHTTYPYKLALLNLDIGLCPVVDNQFNRSKSAIKWMEYAMNNIATIASDIPPYSPVMTNRKNGLLVKENINDWVEGLSFLVKNGEERVGIALEAKEEVLRNHTISSKAYLWKEAYERLMKPEGIMV